MSTVSIEVSIIIPARDEAGTIRTICSQFPNLGVACELVFVEGFSTDHTWDEILRVRRSTFPHIHSIQALKQSNKRGKAAATWMGIRAARGRIIIIYDADMSVPLSALIRFYRMLKRPHVRFVNGSRFLHAHEPGAMHPFNHLGNRFFAGVFSLLLRQKISDTLCGTKAFWRSDYAALRRVSAPFSHLDPYGDFTLLLGAALLRLPIAQVGVRYKARVYGSSKISPFIDGIRLMVLLLWALRTFLKRQ